MELTLYELLNELRNEAIDWEIKTAVSNNPPAVIKTDDNDVEEDDRDDFYDEIDSSINRHEDILRSYSRDKIPRRFKVKESIIENVVRSISEAFEYGDKSFKWGFNNSNVKLKKAVGEILVLQNTISESLGAWQLYYDTYLHAFKSSTKAALKTACESQLQSRLRSAFGKYICLDRPLFHSIVIEYFIRAALDNELHEALGKILNERSEMKPTLQHLNRTLRR